jgi:hypothetical protein
VAIGLLAIKIIANPEQQNQPNHAAMKIKSVHAFAIASDLMGGPATNLEHRLWAAFQIKHCFSVNSANWF